MKAELNGKLSNVLLDSGAGVSIIDENYLKQIDSSAVISKVTDNLVNASGHKMNILGRVKLKVFIKGSTTPLFQDFRVIS